MSGTRQGHGPLAGRRRHADHRRSSAAPSPPTASTGRTSAGWPGPSPRPTSPATPTGSSQAGIHSLLLDACHELRHQRRPPGQARTRGTLEMKTETHAPGHAGRRLSRCAARSCAWPSRSPTARPRVRDADGELVSRATGTFLLHRPDPTPTRDPRPPPDPYRVPPPGPGVCGVCCGPVRAAPGAASPAGRSAAASASPLAPVFPVRLCPLPGPLYTVLMGYKESPVARGAPPLRAHGARALRRLPRRPRALPRRGRGRSVRRRAPGALVGPARRRRRSPAWTGWRPSCAPARATGRRTSSLGPRHRVGHMRPDARAFDVPAALRSTRRRRGASCCSTTPTSAAPGPRARRRRCGAPALARS